MYTFPAVLHVSSCHEGEDDAQERYHEESVESGDLETIVAFVVGIEIYFPSLVGSPVTRGFRVGLPVQHFLGFFGFHG